MYLTYLPILIIPKRIWNKPQKSPAIDIESKTVEILPEDIDHAPEINEAVITVIGPVGPLI